MTVGAIESKVGNIQPSVKKDEVVAKILKSTEERIKKHEEKDPVLGTDMTDTIDYKEMKEALDWEDTLTAALDEYLKLFNILWEHELIYVSKRVRRLDIWIGVSRNYLHCTVGGSGTRLRWYYDDGTLINALKNNALEPNESKEERTCPRCGGKLIEREGRYGKFLGCEITLTVNILNHCR